MLNRQVNCCKWIGRIVLFSLLSTFSPFLRRPVQISLPLFVCIFPFFCSEALGDSGDLNLFFSLQGPPHLENLHSLSSESACS